jgi:hypothetical protein
MPAVKISVIMLAGHGESDDECDSDDDSEAPSAASWNRIAHFLERGFGAAVAQSIAAGRAAVLLLPGYNSPVASLFARGLASQRLPAAALVGVGKLAEPQRSNPCIGTALTDLNRFCTHHMFLRADIDAATATDWDAGYRGSQLVDVAQTIGVVHDSFHENFRGQGVSDFADRCSLAPTIFQHERTEGGDSGCHVRSVYLAKRGSTTEGDRQDALFGRGPRKNEGKLECKGARTNYGVQRGNLRTVTHLVMVVGGGSAAQRDVLHAVRMGWSVIALKGSGGFADRIANAKLLEQQSSSPQPSGTVQLQSSESDYSSDSGSDTGEWDRRQQQLALKQESRNMKKRQRRLRAAQELDASLAEIVHCGSIDIIDLDVDHVSDVTSMCYARMHPPSTVAEGQDPVLFQAWLLYARYMRTRSKLRKSYWRMEISAQSLSLLSIAALVFDQEMNIRCLGVEPGKSAMCDISRQDMFGLSLAQCVLAVATAAATAIIALIYKLGFVQKWKEMKTACSRLRETIFRYRANSGQFRYAATRRARMAVEMAAVKSGVTATLAPDPEIEIAPAVKSATGDSAVSGSKWLRSVLADKRQRRSLLYLHDDDSALGCISPDEYVTFQLQHQSSRIKRFIAPLTFTLTGAHLLIAILMGVTTVRVCGTLRVA